MSVVFSGIQPSGKLHLGNYLGAIKNWVGMQEKNDCMFCVVDSHAITVPQNPIDLKNRIREIAIVYIACGIDPEKSILYQQSRVSGHTELGWILNCVTPMSWLKRMTQFKDKSNKYGIEKVSMGLFDYPVLMASDILLYNVDVVPVGDDQKQHVELARDVAGAFNRQFNVEYFKLPEFYTIKNTTRIMSLKDGTKKMSKSDDSEQSCLYLTDSVDEIKQKIKRAKTDSIPTLSYDKENRPDITNLLNIYSALSEKSVENIISEFQGKGFGAFKESLADVVVESLDPITKKIKDLQKNLDYIDDILIKNSEKANKIAEKRMNEVYKIIGMR